MARLNGALAAIAAMLLVASPAAAARKKPVPAPVAPAPVVPSVKAGVEAWRAGDYPAAVAMWMPFANAGDMDAMFNIGQAYKLGRAVPKDTVIARDWYRRAALKGHLPAQANLGILLFQAGEKSEAIRWLKSAADKNEMRAQYVLGVALWNGDGAPRSLTLAYGYLARASAQGLPEATTALNTLTGSISPLERANGWAVATSLAAGNGIPPEFAGPAPRPVAADSFNRDQVIKPPPRIAAVEAPRIAAVEAPRIAAVEAPRVAVVETPRPANVEPPRAAVVQAPRAVEPTRAAAAPPLNYVQRDAPRPPPPVAVARAATPVAVTLKPVVATAVEKPPTPAVSAPNPLERPVAPPVTTVAIPASTAAVQAEAPKPVQVAAATPPKLISKPEAKPVPAKAAAAKPAPPKPAGWRVQLGAFSKKAQAETAWADVKAKQKLLVADKKPIYAVDESVVKLQLGPYASKTAARDACAKIAFSGRACFVTEG